jgi:4,5-dihydroxyphthalate decarboxylase
MNGTANIDAAPVVSIAINNYEHVRDLLDGDVQVEGVRPIWLRLPVEEIFFRFTLFREWDVSELSLAKYCNMRAAGDETVVAIPVFPSRSFRHSAIWIRADGPLDDPSALVGGRIGVPEWTQTATVYARGVLEEAYEVPLTSVRWVQAGTNEAGRIEPVALTLPPGIELQAVRDQTLNDMLVRGELDAMIAAHPPHAATDGSGSVVRLFTDYAAVERAYLRDTGVFPIMHVIVVRRELYERHRWLAMNLVRAFQEAKRRSLARLLDANAPYLPIPWSVANAERGAALLGGDPWPYGLEPNRPTLEAFLRFAYRQGACARHLTPEDLFVPEALQSFRV